MGGLGVIVEYSTFSHDRKSDLDKLSCSGIYLGSGWILTHGTIVIDLLKEKQAESLIEELKTKGCAINERESPLRTVLDVARSTFKVLLDESNHSTILSSNLARASPKAACPPATSKAMQVQDVSHPGRVQDRDLQLPLVSSSETPSYFCHPVNISALFVQPGITTSLTDMMPASEGWRLTEDQDGEETDVDYEAIILSSFALLKVTALKNNLDTDFSVMPTEELISLVEKYLAVTAVVDKGANICVESSPFGSLSPSVFLNSLSKGIISNICGSDKDIYLTDARCVMGSEGAPVYTTLGQKVNLCGMVISPFCWKRGEWLGLSLLAAARPVLLSLLRCVKYISNEREDHLESSKNANKCSAVQPLKRRVDDLSLEGIAKALDNVVVGISCGGGWGSGIVISSSPGIVLTCAHVIQPAKHGEVVIITADGTHIPGQVIYHTHPSCFVQKGIENEKKQGSSIWDIAIVRTSSSLPGALPLAAQLPPKGCPVVVAGHGIFPPTRFPSPTISHGIISKIVSVEASCLRYPDANESKQIIGDASKGDFNLRSEVVHVGDIEHKRQMKMYCEKSSVLPSLVKSDDEFNLNLEGQQDFRTGKVLLGDGENDVVPVMFQTTCSVYAGNSGGPVILYHPQHGLQVAGVIVCNTRDTANKATFPQINLAVPAPAINKIISAYISSGDKMVLNYLGVECPTVSQLWALGLTPQSHL